MNASRPPGTSTRATSRKHRRKIGHIDHGIGGQNEIGAGLTPAAQALRHLGDLQFRVKAGGAGPLDHARRQVDADKSIDLPGKRSGRQSGAAAEVDRAFEECGLAGGGARRQHRPEQQLRAAIAEIVDQRRLEPRRILIEQHPHIGLRHRRQWLGAKPHQMQAGAVPILCIGADRPAERRDRPIALADLFANFAEREPGRWKIRRQLDSLFEQIGGGDQIALQLQITREFETAVGDQIAGRQEQAGGHGLYGSSRARCAGQARA